MYFYFLRRSITATVDAILEAALAQQEEEKSSVFSFCVPRALAKAALKDYTP